METFPYPSPEKNVVPSLWAATDVYNVASEPTPSDFLKSDEKNLIPLFAAL